MSLLGRTILEEPHLELVFAEAARLAADACRADAALVLERRADGNSLLVQGSARWPVPPAPRDFDSTSGGHVAAALQAPAGRLVVRQLPARADEPAFVAQYGFTTAAVAPVGDAARPFGALVVYSRDPHAFADDTLDCLEAMGALVGLAVRRAQLTAELDRERDERFRLASLVQGSDDAIVSATLDGTILSWNPGAERLYGYAAHEIVGQDVSVLIPAEHEADRHTLLDLVRTGQRIPAFDAVHRRKDGTPVTISLSLSPVSDRHGTVVAVAGIAHDVTETRRLESDLRQAAKMEAVGRLAGGLAHDFNNMLTVIDGYSELVLMKLPADSPVRSLVEEIHKAGERAANLTRQLMVFSRKSLVEPQVLDVSEVVRANVDMLTHIIGEDVAMETDLATALDGVMADRSQLDQVLVNLVINARDAMPHGGRLTIRTAPAEVDASDLPALRGVRPGQYVALAVSDTGIGMDAATRRRIFEPFFTTKRSGRGTGLGLAMVQSFLLQVGGHVTVDSAPGRGATFTLYLPTVPRPVARQTVEAAPHAPSGTETVLVVEDDEAVRHFTGAVLEAAGYEVLAASNGVDALELARTHPRPIHLLMTDVVMPVLGGHALAEQFRGLHPQASVLFTSGYTPDAVSRRGTPIPPASFLQKPYSPAALYRRVRAVLDERT